MVFWEKWVSMAEIVILFMYFSINISVQKKLSLFVYPLLIDFNVYVFIIIKILH